MMRNGTSRRVTRAIVLVSRSMSVPPDSRPATSAPVIRAGRYRRGATLQASGGWWPSRSGGRSAQARSCPVVLSAGIVLEVEVVGDEPVVGHSQLALRLHPRRQLLLRAGAGAVGFP